MPRILDWDNLRIACRRPLETVTPFDSVGIVEQFAGLAGFCLVPELLQCAASNDTQSDKRRQFWQKQPELPTTYGSCWVIFATEEADRMPLLRSAFVLPFQWIQEEPHSSCLPRGMADFADRVVESLSDVPEVAANRWGLRVHPTLGDVDLRGVTLGYESGWAALAGGLLVAATRGRPDPTVWATAAWAGGVCPVDGLDFKLEQAAQFGARKVFVPASANAQHPSLATGIEVIGLPENEPSPRAALRDYLRLLNVPPDHNDPQSDREKWYLSQWEADLAEGYYRTHLLGEVVQHCRAQLPQNELEAGCSHLVTIASRNPELVAIAVGSLRPANCLVLYTEDLATQRDEALMLVTRIAAAQNWCMKVMDQGFTGIPGLLQNVADVVRRFVGAALPGQVVFDLTPGTKEMSFALLFDVAEPGQRLYYLRHEWQGKRVRPFSLQPRLLVAGGGLSFRTSI